MFGRESRIGRALIMWRAASQQSANRQIAYAAAVAAATSATAKVVGLLKEAVVAAIFGLSNQLEIYLMAFVVVGLPTSILINSIQTALIPALVQSEEQPAAEKSSGILSAVSGLTLALMFILLIPWLFGLPWLASILASGFSADARQQLVQAVYWMIPYYFLNGLNLLGYGALQAKHCFIENGLLPIAVPLATITIVAGAGAVRWEVLAVALNVGTLLEFFFVWYTVTRHGESLFPWCPHLTTPVWQLLQGAAALVPGMVVLALGPLIDQAIAASLGEGAVATLGYGYRLPAALSGIVVTAIGITALPYFAKMIHRGELSQAATSLNKFARLLLGCGVLIALVLALVSAPMIKLFFERGAFTAAATSAVSPVQQAYFLQLPAALVAMLSIRLLIALGRTVQVSVVTAVVTLVQVVVAWALSRQLGVTGIALGSVIASILMAIWTYSTALRALLRTRRVVDEPA